MLPHLVKERFHKLEYLCKSFSLEHLGAFCDWLEENGFKHQKYREVWQVCYSHEFKQSPYFHGISIRTKTRTISILKNGKVVIIRSKPIGYLRYI